MEDKKHGIGRWRLVGLAGLILLVGCACSIRWPPLRPPRRGRPQVVRMRVTGYCPCGQCCNWRRNWWGRPVIASGPQRGARKEVGVTASGARARPGTIAADTALFPFGTIVRVPGYGYGRVEDRGGAIKGYRLDLYFRTHKQALVWGVQYLDVEIWPPQ